MIKYVVWGAGHRGKRLQRFLKDRIVAFIDKDFKNLIELNGAPVISFNDYLEKYYGYPIVISPLYIEEISAKLAPYLDIPIIKMVQEVSEISFGLPISFDKLNLSRFAKDKPLYLYGINLFSLVLHEYLENNGWKNLTFLPGNTGINFEQAEALGLNVSDKADRKSIILCTEKDMEKATLACPANRIEDFWNLSMQTKKYNHTELKKFHNIHKGQRLFLIATGPSLKIEDLDKLYNNHEVTMSVNMVYRCFDRTEWRPNYYVFTDMYGLKQYEEEIRNLDLPCMFLSDVGVEGWVSKELKENMNICHLISDKMDGWPRISSEISEFILRGIGYVAFVANSSVYGLQRNISFGRGLRLQRRTSRRGQSLYRGLLQSGGQSTENALSDKGNICLLSSYKTLCGNARRKNLQRDARRKIGSVRARGFRQLVLTLNANITLIRKEARYVAA